MKSLPEQYPLIHPH